MIDGEYQAAFSRRLREMSGLPALRRPSPTGSLRNRGDDGTLKAVLMCMSQSRDNAGREAMPSCNQQRCRMGTALTGMKEKIPHFVRQADRDLRAYKQ